ncbi:alpha/beta hydrolase [Hoyosella rhizosphaerae]|uniref:Alpha/beta hydrolase n=1 Tax=Hoyosella rhizosphaerae TaxID=1755582 RepID=A0A916XJA9_9ACTN|nr:alpha/beta hydrolase [Hoyosella rhizosphaerae]MBN4928397.1 alpha/beta hydrolase [Hoyosella rhizosphaerae]GGC74607.1 alpha/beta hydrolase [Hoyosella rhizosphaerae]
MSAVYQVSSSDGTRIVYRVTGDRASPPLLLVHGWAQSSQCWGPDLITLLSETFRVIAIDLRGHGYSDAPHAAYSDSTLWADDIAAVLARENAHSAMVVGWSYGGLVICDYLAERGCADISGVVFVGAITSIGRDCPGGAIGSAMRNVIQGGLSAVPSEAIRALGSFGTALVPTERTDLGPMQQALFGTSLCTPPHVRTALFRRHVNHDATLGSLTIPALFIHGTNDQFVDINASRHGVTVVPKSQLSEWEGVGHAPFLEDPVRCAEEIRAFASCD